MEKFALLNLLKAIETLSPPKPDAAGQPPAQPTNQSSQPEQPPAQPTANTPPQTVNVMANVLSRHEEISNRLRNKK